MPALIPAPPLVDAAAASPSLRTLGTGANQAAAGNDTRFVTPTATPTANSVPLSLASGLLDPLWVQNATPSQVGLMSAADKTKLDGISGTNTGDVTLGTANGLSLTGQALSLGLVTTSIAGAMSAADKTKLDGIEAGATASAGASGVAGAIQFSDGTTFASDATNLFWDDTNNRLGIGTATPAGDLHIQGTVAGVIQTRIENLSTTGYIQALLLNDNSGYFGLQLFGTAYTGVPNRGRLIAGSTIADLRIQAVNTAAPILFINGGGVGEVEIGRFDPNGSFKVDGTTFNVDAVNNRVGVGTASPTTTLDVAGWTTTNGLTSTGSVVFRRPTAGLVTMEPPAGGAADAQMFMFDSHDANASNYRLNIGLQNVAGYFSNSFTTGMVVLSSTLGVAGGPTTAYDLYIGAHPHDGTMGADPTKMMVFKGDAPHRIGIGTGAPEFALDLNKNLPAAHVYVRQKNAAADGWGGFISHNDVAGVTLQSIGSTYVTADLRNVARLIASTADLRIQTTALSAPISFYTNDGTTQSERGRFDANGNFKVDGTTFHVDAVNNRVGVGTASPSHQFHVEGLTAGLMLVRTDAAAAAEGFIALGTNSTLVGQIRGLSGGGLRFTNGGSATEWARFTASGDFQIDTNTLYVDATNNRVGIGTASPISALDVVGESVFSDWIYVGRDSTLTAKGVRLAPATAQAGKQYSVVFTDGSRADGHLHWKATALNESAFYLADNNGTLTHPRVLIGYRHGTVNPTNAQLPAGSLAVAGSVGIGTATPASQLHVISESTVVERGGILQQNSTDAASVPIYMRKGRGTAAAPTSVATGDYIASINFVGHDGTAYRNIGGVLNRVNGTPGLNSVPADIHFWTSTSDEGDPVLNNKVRLTIRSGGNVEIANELQVGGNVRLLGAASITGKITLDATDTSATPGAVTINKPSGQVSIAAGASDVTVTNNLVTASSVVMAVMQQTDATLTYIMRVEPAAGSFTIYGNSAATGASVKVGFVVFN